VPAKYFEELTGNLLVLGLPVWLAVLLTASSRMGCINFTMKGVSEEDKKRAI